MSLWQRVGSLKNNLGEITKNTLSKVAKAVEQEGFFENEDADQEQQKKKTQGEEMKQNGEDKKAELLDDPLHRVVEENKKATETKNKERKTSKELQNIENFDQNEQSITSSTTPKGTSKPKIKIGGGGNPLVEFKQMIEEKDNLLKKFSQENEDLIAQRNEAQKQVSELTERLEKLKNVGNGGEAESKQRNVVLPKSDNVGEYVQEYLEQYKEEFYNKMIENLNNDIINQLELEEGDLGQAEKDLLKIWVKKSEVTADAQQIISQEKIIRPLFDESVLKEEIEALKLARDQFSKEIEEYKARIKELEGESEKYKSEFSKNKDETEKSYEKYAEDIIKYEQTIENLKEEVALQKEEMKSYFSQISTLEQQKEENLDKIRGLEMSLSAHFTEKEDYRQRYQGLEEGMKDFEMAIAELNQENQTLQNQIAELRTSHTGEKDLLDKQKDNIPIGFKDDLVSKLNKLNRLYNGFNFEHQINPKLIIDDGRVVVFSLNMALEDSLNTFVEEANKKFTSELAEKQNKEKEKYDKLSKNAIKVQSDLKDSKKREKELLEARDKLKEENEELLKKLELTSSSSTQTTEKITQLQKTIQDLQDGEKRHSDEVSAKEREIEQIRAQLTSLQDEDAEKNSYISKLEKELSAIPELTTQMEINAQELFNLREIINEKFAENETLNLTIASLQSMIDENQNIQEKVSGEYDDELRKVKQQLEDEKQSKKQLEEYREKYHSMDQRINQYEERIQEFDLKLREAEQEKNNIKAEAFELMKKAKSEAMNKESLIDRRVITTFLIKYFDVSSTFSVKLQILETLSSILNFSEDERAKIGLHQKRLEHQMAKQGDVKGEPFESGNAPSSKTFSDMFKSFLTE